MSDTPKTIGHQVEIPLDLNLDIKEYIIAMERRGLRKTTIPLAVVRLADKANRIRLLLEAKEFNDKDLMNKIKYIMQDNPGAKA
jgi:hypothetical protein